METSLRLEFHCHTYFSKDSLTTPASLVATCRRKGIDRVVVTDHNSIRGALAAQAIDPELVIVGEEIMTTGGELLAAYMQEEIPAGLTPHETIRRLRQQGAFISVSHPFDRNRIGHWKLDLLNEILPLVDAIEIFNSRCISPEFNVLATEYANKHQIAGTAGSDAHVTMELGRAVMRLPHFSNADELRQALPHVQYELKISPAWVHLFSRIAVWRKRLPGYRIIEP